MAPSSIPSNIYGYALLATVSIVMLCVSLGTTHWLSSGNGDVHAGLFKVCMNGKCVDYHTSDESALKFDDLDVIKGLLFAGLGCYVVSAVLMGHMVFVQRMVVQTKNRGAACLIVCVAGAVLACAGAAKFVSLVDDSSAFAQLYPGWNFDYSLYTGSASCGMSVLAGIFALVGVSNLVRLQEPRGLLVQQPIQGPAGVWSPGGHPYSVVSPMGSQPAGTGGYTTGHTHGQPAYYNQ